MVIFKATIQWIVGKVQNGLVTCCGTAGTLAEIDVRKSDRLIWYLPWLRWLNDTIQPLTVYIVYNSFNHMNPTQHGFGGKGCCRK